MHIYGLLNILNMQAASLEICVCLNHESIVKVDDLKQYRVDDT